MKKYLKVAPLLAAVLGCSPHARTISSVPAQEYAAQFKSGPAAPVVLPVAQPPQRAQLRFANGEPTENPALPGVDVYRSSVDMRRDYQGPLELGDPGVAASLWKESRGATDILRDDRAWLSGDLITIIVTESDQGSRQAKTDTKSETTLGAALNALFGLPQFLQGNNDTQYGDIQGGIDPSNLVQGSSTMEFKGEGKTDRKNTLTARISAMVAEVLPTGILRIEGKKIIAVNDEEQIMIISGLARTRDINSANEIDSSKIANMRIDYYGKGTVDEAQRVGWGTRLLRNVWPF